MLSQPQAVDVAVIGAAGHTGRPLLQALLRRNAKVRAILRSAARAEGLSRAADIAVADLGDVTALRGAFQNAAVVHFIPPVYQASEECYADNVIQAAAAVGVGRLVYHSVLHANTPRMPHHARKARVEVMLRESALVWTIIQPSMYTTTALRYFDEGNALLQPPFDPERRFNLIDEHELGEVVAKILCEPGHEYATYELAGMQRLDFHDIAAALSRALGRVVSARKIDSEASLRGRQFTPEMQNEARAMHAYYDGHGFPANGNVLRMFLGREPMTFEASVQRWLKLRPAKQV